jgi:hypothetical protein
LAMILLLGSVFSAPQLSAQRNPAAPGYGSDVQIFNYADCFNATSRVSVALNGWIYVLTQISAPSYGYRAWRVFRSINNGEYFTELCQWEFYNDSWLLQDADMVVTGDDPSNINVWVAEIANLGVATPSTNYCRVTQWDAAGNYIATPYYYDYGEGTNVLYDVSIATDYRSPGTGNSPFVIALAYTGHWGSTYDYVTYAFSLDGGVNFTDQDIYWQAGNSVLGKISLALGATSTYNWGRYAVAFEMNKVLGDLGDIGVMMNFTDGVGAWTDPVMVNHTYNGAILKSRAPTISIMDNVYQSPTSPNQFPLVVAYEDWSSGPGSVDLMYNSLADTYIMDTQPTESDFSLFWMGNANGHDDLEPNLAFDLSYNNFLLTYASGDGNELVYRYCGINGILAGDWSPAVGYRDATTPFTWNVHPTVDIDLTKGNACFSWTEQTASGIQSVWFDAEWSVVGMNEKPSQSLDFMLSPNPASDKVFIKTKDQEGLSVTITTMMGQVVLSRQFNSASNAITVSSLAKGVYLVKVTGKSGSSTKKLVVE